MSAIEVVEQADSLFKFPCDGPCPPKAHRPYSRSRKHVSVTTLIDKLPKDGLMWGSAKETALFAVHHQHVWRDMEPADAVDMLRRHFRGVWDRSADRGTIVHSINEAWIYGVEWSPSLVDLNQLHVKTDEYLFDIVDKEIGPYVEGLGGFWMDTQPDTIATEVVLRNNTLGLVGTTDWITRLPGITDGERYFDSDVWMLDVKTTSELDPDKGAYLDSWRPQLFLYQTAEEVVHFHETTEVAALPVEDCFPRPNRCGILHMRGDGGYELIEVDTQAEILPRLVDALKVVREWGLTGGHKSPAPVIVSERHREPIPARPDAPVDVDAWL